MFLAVAAFPEVRAPFPARLALAGSNHHGQSDLRSVPNGATSGSGFRAPLREFRSLVGKGNRVRARGRGRVRFRNDCEVGEAVFRSLRDLWVSIDWSIGRVLMIALCSSGSTPNELSSFARTEGLSSLECPNFSPGTSCLATIVLSLRDKRSPFAVKDRPNPTCLRPIATVQFSLEMRLQIDEHNSLLQSR